MGRGDHEQLAEVTAEECCSAVNAFLDGEPEEWDVPRLSRWLIREYMGCTRHAPRERRVDRRAFDRVLCGESVVTLVREARAQLADRLWELGNEGRCDFVWECVHDGLIVPVTTNEGRCFVPVDRARAGLARRVLSLLAIDYMARPWAYEEHEEAPVSYEASGERALDAQPIGRVALKRVPMRSGPPPEDIEVDVEFEDEPNGNVA